MKRVILPLLLLLLLTHCQTSIQTQRQKGDILKEPLFKQSNQYLFEQTLNKIPIDSLLDSAIPGGSTIAIHSMETNKKGDRPILAIIEDTFIQKLHDSRFTVLDRDDETVAYLMQEAGDGFRNYKPAESNNFLEDADYLLLYRVLEAGIVYRPDINRDLSKIKREALIRLNLRIANTQTGEVNLAASSIAKNQDNIDRRLWEDLASFHYSFFGYSYPVVKHTERGNIRIMKPIWNYETEDKTKRKVTPRSRRLRPH